MAKKGAIKNFGAPIFCAGAPRKKKKVAPVQPLQKMSLERCRAPFSFKIQFAVHCDRKQNRKPFLEAKAKQSKSLHVGSMGAQRAHSWSSQGAAFLCLY